MESKAEILNYIKNDLEMEERIEFIEQITNKYLILIDYIYPLNKLMVDELTRSYLIGNHISTVMTSHAILERHLREKFILNIGNIDQKKIEEWIRSDKDMKKSLKLEKRFKEDKVKFMEGLFFGKLISLCFFLGLIDKIESDLLYDFAKKRNHYIHPKMSSGVHLDPKKDAEEGITKVVAFLIGHTN